MAQNFDLVVIGAGPGGYIAAIRAAQLGMRVACVEKWRNPAGEPALGGTCLNVGCIPSKALLASSEEFENASQHLGDHGIAVSGVKLDLAKMMARKDSIVSKMTKGIEFLFRKNKITWLKGHGRFVATEDETIRIEVSDDDDLHVSNPEGTSTILIKLAHTTATDNEDTKIETAVRALLEVAGVDVSAMTVAGNAAYDDAEPVGSALGSPAGCVLDFGDGKTLTISSGLPGSWYNALSFAVETAEDDVLAVAHDEGVITISLANETGTNNEASDIQALVQALTVAGLDMTAFTVAGSDEYNAAEPISGEIAATPMTGGEELITEATLEGGDDTHLFVVCKA